MKKSAGITGQLRGLGSTLMSTCAKALYRIGQTIYSLRYRSPRAYCRVIKMLVLLCHLVVRLYRIMTTLVRCFVEILMKVLTHPPHLVLGAPMSWHEVAIKALASF